MDVLDLIYNQFVLTANCFGCQPTISELFQHLIPQMLTLAAGTIHTELSEYACGERATVMFSLDQY